MKTIHFYLIASITGIHILTANIKTMSHTIDTSYQKLIKLRSGKIT